MLERILVDGKYPEVLRVKLEKPGPNEAAAADLTKQKVPGIPFGFRILAAIVKDLRSPPDRFRDFATHNEKVFDHIKILFEENNLAALAKMAKGIEENLGGHLVERLRLAALLHDVGKSLDFARHPILGWHVLFDLALVGDSDRKARTDLINHLGLAGFDNPADEYRRLGWFVRDHDKFGVISTGEASYVILGSLISLGRDAANRSIAQIRDTWLLNIADIAGTPEAKPRLKARVSRANLAHRLNIRDDKLEALTRDWNQVYTVLKGRSYAQVLTGLRELSETPELTVQRVSRLLKERARNWPGLYESFSDELVQEAFDTHLSPKDFLPFCRDFAMVAKLDYALQFWSELADYSYISKILDPATATTIIKVLTGEGETEQSEEKTEQRRKLEAHWNAAYADFNDNNRSPFIGLLVDFRKNRELGGVWGEIEKVLTARGTALAHAERVAGEQAELLIAILRRIVTAYQGLIRGSIASERAAIGVGFSYLRSDDSEKRFALYELLSGKGAGRERGLRWLIDEIASWEMLA